MGMTEEYEQEMLKNVRTLSQAIIRMEQDQISILTLMKMKLDSMKVELQSIQEILLQIVNMQEKLRKEGTMPGAIGTPNYPIATWEAMMPDMRDQWTSPMTKRTDMTEADSSMNSQTVTAEWTNKDGLTPSNGVTGVSNQPSTPATMVAKIIPVEVLPENLEQATTVAT